jgi:large subunit ribosomal protein L29
MNVEQLRDLTRQELLQKHHDLVEELFNLRLRKRVSEISNPLQLRTLRRDLARIETLLREDDLGIRQVSKPKERVG